MLNMYSYMTAERTPSADEEHVIRSKAAEQAGKVPLSSDVVKVSEKVSRLYGPNPGP